MASLMDPPLGSIVLIPQGKGVVRFKGPTSFMATGKWIGVELYEKTGKNDGSVDGIAYFTCELGYGVFVRPSQIKAVQGSELDARPPPVTRPTGGHQRTPSMNGLLRANSIKSPPSSNASASGTSTRSASPAKPSVPSLARSVSIKPPASPTVPARKTLITKPSISQDAPSPPTRNGTTSPVKMAQASSAFPTKRTSSPLSLPPVQASQSEPSPRAPSPPPPQPQPVPRDDTELQELRIKVRRLEAKGADATRHIRELQTRLDEAEAFVALRPKLQAKLSALQTEVIASRRELTDANQLVQLNEGRFIDAQDQLELAMLDKEMAEEKAESMESELEDVKERLAILEVENEVLKAEVGEVAEGPKKDSLAYIQLEKQNERLKEALIKLRDMTQETEVDQRRRISEMERDVADVENLRSLYQEAQGKLSSAETQIESLKEQLDDALSIEDMLVQLTERNLMLTEKIEEMRIENEELEALRDLNEEIEESHTDTINQLREDLEAKDMEIRADQRKINELEDNCQDFENTISRFRELVMQLQSELDQLRAQTESAQHQSASATQQSAAVMSLNIKLQSNMAKNQARLIDLETHRIDTKLAKEHLEIVSMYLPEIFYSEDADAIKCYLSFQRLGAKVDLINSVVAQIHNLPDALSGDISEMLPGVCELRSRMSLVATLCKRFATIVRNADVETFMNIKPLYEDIQAREGYLDMHIDLLRRDQFRENECIAEIAKLQDRLALLDESFFHQFDTELIDRQLGYVTAFDLDLDTYAASMLLLRTSIVAVVKEDDVVIDFGGYNIEQELFEPLDKLLSQTKNVKGVARKLVKRLEDLSKDSATLKPQLLPQMQALNNCVTELINFGFHFVQASLPHISDARAAKCSFQLSTVLNRMKDANNMVVKDLKPSASLWDPVSEAMSRLIEASGKMLPAALEQGNIIKVTSAPPPWKARVVAVKAALAVNVEAERKLVTLNDELSELARRIRGKDQTIEESNVRIQMMERRLEMVKKQAEEIGDLQAQVSKLKKQEKLFEDTTKQLDAEIEQLYKQNELLKSQTVAQESQPAVQAHEPENVAIEGNLETWHLLERIEALRGTVRFLRMENSFLKGQDLLREIESLPNITPLQARPPTPPLVPSADSDTSSDSDSEGEAPPLPTLTSLTSETRRLYKDVIKYSTAPRVVDLSEINARRAEAKGGKIWIPKKKMPSQVVWERKQEGERLNRRVKGLLERASAIGASL